MKTSFLALALALLLALPGASFAHSPVFDCFDNGDGTISCQGGFSDGSSAAGVKVHIKDGSGKTVETKELDKNGELSMKKPEGKYSMELDAGEGHKIDIPGDKIVE